MPAPTDYPRRTTIAGPSLVEQLARHARARGVRIGRAALARMTRGIPDAARDGLILALLGTAVIAVAAWAAIASLAAFEHHRYAQRVAATAPERAAIDRADADARRRASARALPAPPMPGPTMMRLARALPSDARLAWVALGSDGAIEVAIDAPDPDLLRMALANDALLGRLHERDQRVRPDGRIRVLLRTGR